MIMISPANYYSLELFVQNINQYRSPSAVLFPGLTDKSVNTPQHAPGLPFRFPKQQPVYTASSITSSSPKALQTGSLDVVDPLEV